MADQQPIADYDAALTPGALDFARQMVQHDLAEGRAYAMVNPHALLALIDFALARIEPRVLPPGGGDTDG